MSDRNHEPTDADGPLFKEASRRAREVDGAPTPDQRRGAWARFIPAAAAALAEGFLRDTMVSGAVLFSILGIVFGATSGNAAWAVSMVILGLASIALVFVAIGRRWSFGKQWAVLLGVSAVQIALIIAVWRFQ